jgi:hypothetical protein
MARKGLPQSKTKYKFICFQAKKFRLNTRSGDRDLNRNFIRAEIGQTERFRG